MGDLAWTSLRDALLWIERLRPDDTGVLSFGAEPVGGIFVENQRICWAAADGLQSRLRDLLQRRFPTSTSEIARAYEDARSEGRHFGQSLVERGLIEPGDLELALRRHSAESLVKLCRAEQPTVWSARQGRGYAPRFTFRPLDMLLDVIELTSPEARSRALHELAPVAGPGRRAASYHFTGGAGPAVPLAVLGEWGSLERVCSLGEWALGLPAATRELAMSPSFALAATADGTTVSVWWRESLLHAVVCDDRAAIASVTAYHLSSA